MLEVICSLYLKFILPKNDIKYITILQRLLFKVISMIIERLKTVKQEEF